MRVCAVALLVQRELTSAGSRSISWQFALELSGLGTGARAVGGEGFFGKDNAHDSAEDKLSEVLTHIILGHHSNTPLGHALLRTA